jgi:WD40 repeat protein
LAFQPPVAFDRPGQLVAIAGYDGSKAVRLWNLATGELAFPPEQGHRAPIVHGVFSHDGRLFATASWDYSAQIWNSNTGQPLGPRLSHDGALNQVAFSRDGKRLATTSEDNTVRIWDVETGKTVTSPLVHPGWAIGVQFNRDGDRIATTSRKHSVRFWNAITGQPISPNLLQEISRVVQVSYTADESRIVTAGFEGGLRVWPIPTDDRPTEDLIRRGEAYQGYRVDEFGGFVSIPEDEYRAMWSAMKKQYPQDFSVSPRNRLAWHQRQMNDAIKEKKTGAAIFHWLHAHPEQASLRTLPR